MTKYFCEQYGISPRGLEYLRRIVSSPIHYRETLDHRILDPLRKKRLVQLYEIEHQGPFAQQYPAYWVCTQRGFDIYSALLGVDAYEPVSTRARGKRRLRPELRVIDGGA